ncbi:MAG: DUF2194 domain-containing protein [Lachnospiraceae bacterium]|nr:DUF2194 domain-containing protein [Lachnospiraceae bacterium]
MISRRNYITIGIMMAVICFLFLFCGVARDQWNDYDTNSHVPEGELLTQADAWDAGQNTVEYSEAAGSQSTGEDSEASGSQSTGEDSEMSDGQNTESGSAAATASDLAVYIGSLREDALGDTVREWCTYTKRELLSYQSLSSWYALMEETPEILLINSDYLNYDTDVELLMEIAEEGISMIFCNLPDVSVIRDSEELQELLGIRTIRAESCTLDGIQLFEGFLIGGKVEYIAEDEEKEERQDLELTAPWYQTGSRTKVYMAGMMEEADSETDPYPALIWRSSYGNAYVFAVCGDYLEGLGGPGFLTAMVSEMYDYDIYPIVNAQNLVIVNGPVLASENRAEMQTVYSRDSIQLFRDVIFPGLAAISEDSGFVLTCLLSVRTDSSGINEPDTDDLVYYLKYLKEQSAEMGLSLWRTDGAALAEASSQDKAFWEASGSAYQYGVLYAAEGQLEEAAALTGEAADGTYLENVTTVVTADTEDCHLLDYINETITVQGITSDAYSHTFSEDLTLRALETALGYSTISLDLTRVLWPEDESDHWENLYEDFSGNIGTYWKAFADFERTTLSESDERVRAFLSLDYTDTREGDTISLTTMGLSDTAWFLLRTNGEEIVSVEGGSWEEIETDVYLIEVNEQNVKIILENSTDLYYY